jgi:hypothetical protein
MLHDKLKLRISAGVQNVFVITKYKGLDPEIAEVWIIISSHGHVFIN